MTNKRYFYIKQDGTFDTYLSEMTDGVVTRKYLDSYENESLAITYVDYMNDKLATQANNIAERSK